MVEEGHEEERAPHDEHALGPVQLGFQVQEQAVAKSSEKGSDCEPDAEVSLLGSSVEELTGKNEGHHEHDSAGAIEDHPDNEDELVVRGVEMGQAHGEIASHLNDPKHREGELLLDRGEQDEQKGADAPAAERDEVHDSCIG